MALRNAVRHQTEGHAYLFSGPRGTGKTSTARILAKALNCENLQNGEPCCECTPCVEMEAGRSFDLFELDAASNNGVDAVRDLIERAAVGSPGRTKVYILDEVHMLSAAASNALLKTLEEPPDHVRFVLATTDPQKVLPTIRSRTQHFEFQLLSAQELETQVRSIVADAELDVDDEAIAWVVQKGRGSSRDTLSALDQVVAAGGVVTRAEPVEQLYESLVAKDTGRAVLAVADALAQGHDPRVLGAAFLDSLRDAFLVSLHVEVPHLMEHDRELYGRWAAQLGTPALTRAMEAVGGALVEMRQAADPRVPLEVALVRLTSAQDDSLAGLVERIERLEQALAAGGAPAPSAAAVAERPAAERPAAERAAPAAAAAAADDVAPATSAGSGASGPAQARAELARRRAAREGTPVDESTATRSPAGPSRAAPSARPAPPPVPGAAPKPAPPTPPAAEPPAAVEPPPVEPPPVEPPPTEPPPAEPEPSAAGQPPPQPAAPEPAAPEAATPDTTAAEAPAPASNGTLDVAQVAAALDAVLPELRPPAKAACQDGSVLRVDDTTVVFELGTGVPLRHAEKFRADIESALQARLGQRIALELVSSGDGAAAGAPRISGGAVDLAEPDVDAAAADDPDDELTIDIAELEDAHGVAETGIERLTKAFPGAVVLDEDEVIA
jgi:DNA polymerase-3 subunit gamma/tau